MKCCPPDETTTFSNDPDDYESWDDYIDALVDWAEQTQPWEDEDES